MMTYHRAEAKNKQGFEFIHTGDIVKTVCGDFKMLDERDEHGIHYAENQETKEIIRFSETLSLFTAYKIINKDQRGA